MKKTFQCIFAMLLMAGCQEGEDITGNGSQIGNQEIPAQITVISEDDYAIYQIDVETSNESQTEYNLTETISAFPTYQSMHIHGSQVSFIYKNGQDVNAIFKDFADQSSQVHDLTSKIDDPYQGINYGNSVEDYLLLFNRSGPDYLDLSVLALNVKNGTSRKITFGRGTSYSSRILYDNEWLLIKYTEESGNRVLASVNLVTGEVNTKISNDSYFAFLNKGQMHMFFCPSGKYEVYDVSDLSLVESRSTEICNDIFDWDLPIGLNRSQVDGDHLLVYLGVPQPSPDLTSPGIYNLSSGQMVEDRLISTTIRLELYDQYPQSYIRMTTYTANLAEEQIVFGYRKEDSNGIVSGGLIFTDFTGEIMKEISLDRPPQEIIITKP